MTINSPLWTPSPERISQSNFTAYFDYLKKKYNKNFSSYASLYEWSVENTGLFWESLWKHMDIISSPYSTVVGTKKMPGTEWFKGAQLSFAENLLRYRDDHVALVGVGEDKTPVNLTYKQLYEKVAQCQKALIQAGVGPGDRVAAFVPNIPEVVVAMLATNSVGGIFSSCSPDFGIKGVLDRFGQIKPKILITADGYSYNGKGFSSLERVSQIIKELPSVEKVIVVPYQDKNPDISLLRNAILWPDFLNNDATEVEFNRLPFNHPLYIMYSSGTTGVPKCIVHGQGGTLIQHLKELSLHTNLKREDRICYLTTCGWMMWNWLVSSLAVGATVVLSEGSPGYPTLQSKWKMVANEGITIFGLSPKLVSMCEKEKVIPKTVADMDSLHTILSTGSPLSEDNFKWIYKEVKQDLQVSSICGGTDILSCFMLGNPLLPVYTGEIQCRGLGMKVAAYDESGKPVIGQKGELVCEEPFPSMPIEFWDDPEDKKYKKAYFNRYKHVWHHGDYIEVNSRGGVIVYGRSDATLNPGGVRIGTAEIYRQVETIEEIKDSIVVGQKWQDDVRVVLFVVLSEGVKLTEDLEKRIKQVIRKGASPRHVPAKILSVSGIPYTISGKKVELAVAHIIHNEPINNADALVNPKILEEFKNRDELQR